MANTIALDFEQAYQDLLNHSLQMNIIQAECAAKGAERWQAAARPNPELTVSLDTIGSERHNDDVNELFVGITQLVEIGGKRSARQRVAAADQYSSCWNIEIAKNELYADLMHAFIDVAAMQERLSLAQAQHALSLQTSECITLKTSTGKTAPLDERKAQLACRYAKLQWTKLQKAMIQAKKKLTALWSCHPPHFDSVHYDLYALSPPPPFDELTASLPSNPTLAKSQAEVLKANQAVALERSQRFPDVAVQLGVSTERFYRTPTFNVGVDIPLMLFDSNEGNICRATYEQCQAVYNEMNTACQLNSSLSIIYEEWLSAYELALAIKNQLLPTAEETYELNRLSYQESKTDDASLIDARNMLFDIKEQYLDAVEDYHHKRAEVFKLTGKK